MAKTNTRAHVVDSDNDASTGSNQGIGIGDVNKDSEADKQDEGDEHVHASLKAPTRVDSHLWRRQQKPHTPSSTSPAPAPAPAPARGQYPSGSSHDNGNKDQTKLPLKQPPPATTTFPALHQHDDNNAKSSSTGTSTTKTKGNDEGKGEKGNGTKSISIDKKGKISSPDMIQMATPLVPPSSYNIANVNNANDDDETKNYQQNQIHHPSTLLANSNIDNNGKDASTSSSVQSKKQKVYSSVATGTATSNTVTTSEKFQGKKRAINSSACASTTENSGREVRPGAYKIPGIASRNGTTSNSNDNAQSSSSTRDLLFDDDNVNNDGDNDASNDIDATYGSMVNQKDDVYLPQPMPGTRRAVQQEQQRHRQQVTAAARRHAERMEGRRNNGSHSISSGNNFEDSAASIPPTPPTAWAMTDFSGSIQSSSELLDHPTNNDSNGNMLEKKSSIDTQLTDESYGDPDRDDNDNTIACAVPIDAELVQDNEDEVAKRVKQRLEAEMAERLEQEVANRLKKERETQVVAQAVMLDRTNSTTLDFTIDGNDQRDIEANNESMTSRSRGRSRRIGNGDGYEKIYVFGYDADWVAILSCALCFLIAGGVVGTLFGVGILGANSKNVVNGTTTDDDAITPSMGDDALSNSIPSINPSSFPTASPTIMLSSRFEKLVDRIGHIVIIRDNNDDDGDSIDLVEYLRNDATSVQFKVFNWMAHNDTWSYDFDDNDDDDDNNTSAVDNDNNTTRTVPSTTTPTRIENFWENIPIQILIERYAVVYFFYFTNDRYDENGNIIISWRDGVHFLTARPVCTWNDGETFGIFCDDDDDGDNSNDNDSTNATQSPDATTTTNNNNNNDDDDNNTTNASKNLVTRILLNNNGITGFLPTQLALLTSLTRLDLDENFLVGTVPSFFITVDNAHNTNNDMTTATTTYSLSNLDTFWVRNNLLGGSVSINFIEMFPKLTDLDLLGNIFTGTVPTEFGLLTDIVTLFVGGNRLYGTIPTELVHLSQIQTLDFYANSLSGTIPTVIGNLTTLQRLYLETNELTGTLPTELGRLSSLTHLWLQENYFHGQVPTEWSTMTNLDKLYLESNDLNGTVDGTFCFPSSSLSTNDTTTTTNGTVVSDETNGTFPTSIFDQTTIDDFWTDCSGHPPEIVCTCCNYCCNDEDDECYEII